VIDVRRKPEGLQVLVTPAFGGVAATVLTDGEARQLIAALQAALPGGADHRKP
jgi:hypothetical protein